MGLSKRKLFLLWIVHYAVVMQDTDTLLVQEFLAGDATAFDAIVEKYHGNVYRLAYKFTKRSEDAQDIAQDTFLRAYQALLKRPEKMNLKPWLMTICVNLCRNLAKRKKSYRFSDLESEEEGDNLVERLQDKGLNPKDLAIKKELSAWVQDAVQKLPPKYQMVIELRYVEDLSYEEIADVLKLPLNTVKVHLNRAKKSLEFFLSPS